MKKDNNLLKVIYNGKVYYFTKISYITRLCGLQGATISRIMEFPDCKTAQNYNIKIELVDGSNIEYKYINEI